MQSIRKINIGCGRTFHPDWINLDVSTSDPNVLVVDINKGLPFPSRSVDVCYSSHVLEHLDRDGACKLLAECFRVLNDDGIIRLVLPDLEALAREYIRAFEDVSSGNRDRELDYDWIMLELYDQTVRSAPGGKMAQFLASLKEESRDFVRSRIGVEADQFWGNLQYRPSESKFKLFLNKSFLKSTVKISREKLAGLFVYLIAGKAAFKSFQLGIFRSSGEIHQWMYDRYSITRLLNDAGFINVKICAANESAIPAFEKYSLDILNGVVRKPDSFYVEAFKS